MTGATNGLSTVPWMTLKDYSARKSVSRHVSLQYITQVPDP